MIISKKFSSILALLLFLTAATAIQAQTAVIYQTSDAHAQTQGQQSMGTLPSYSISATSVALMRTSSASYNSFGNINSPYRANVQSIAGAGVQDNTTPAVRKIVDNNTTNPGEEPLGPIPFTFITLLILALIFYRKHHPHTPPSPLRAIA